MTYCFGDIRVWSRRILLNICWVSIFFDILIANISWAVAQNPLNHIIFWKSVMRILRYTYINCFKRLRFLAEVSTKSKKMHFVRQFRNHNSGRKHGNKKMTSFFSSAFSTLFEAFIFVFQNSRNSFACGLPFGPFWSVKYLNLGQKLPIRTAHHIFLVVYTLRLLKIYIFVPRGGAKRGIGSLTISFFFETSNYDVSFSQQD